MTWRRARAKASLALGTLLVPWLTFACNSPTLPTPPPVEPFKLDIPAAELTPDGEQVSLSGTALPGALVIFVNRSLLHTDVMPIGGFAPAAPDTGRYSGLMKVDLRCAPTNVVDISQRDIYGRDSEVRTFSAPNILGDASLPPMGGATCSDASRDAAGEASQSDASEAGSTADDASGE